MSKETILVTGGAGFIGSHLCERLIARSNRVVCVDNFDLFYSPEVKRKNIENVLKDNHFQLEECDIRNKDNLKKIFDIHRIDSIIHMAARAGVRPSISEPLIYQDVNIRGTLNLLELSKEYNIKNYIFASSSSVYGDCIHVPFKEDNALAHPISPYAASKQAGELFCYTYHHLYHIPITCLRFFTVYGPRQRPDMAIHKFTRLIDMGEEIQIYSDGSSKRDYTYISDVIDGIVSALDNQFGFEIINLGNSKTIALKELVSLIENNLGKKAKTREIPAQPGDVFITYADISKAKSLLNYNPKVNINEGIRSFVQWYRNDKK
jgi:UDP-glucuronate 4-epimerase